MRKLIFVVAVAVAIVAGLIVSGVFSPQVRRDRLLRRLNDNGVVVRRSCGLGEARVDGARWSEMSARAQQEAATALAGWCAEQGGDNRLTILDSNTHATLGRWNGTSLEIQR